MASPSVPAEAYWAYGAFYLSTFGRFEESTAQMRHAVERDPLSVLWRGILMGHLVCARRFEEALQEGQKALEIADDEMHPHLAFGEVYLALGRVTKPSPPRRERIGPSRSNPWARGCLRQLCSDSERRIGQRRSFGR